MEEAIIRSKREAKTITSRREKSEIEYPAIIICPFPGFKPSLSKKLDYAAKDLFRFETSDKLLFDKKTVPKVFEEYTYGDSITFSAPWKSKFFPLKEGETKFKVGNVTETITLKKVSTAEIGMCHVIYMKPGKIKVGNFLVEFKDPINSSDIPDHFSIYVLPRNEWQGIVTRVWQGEKPLKIDTSSYSFPLAIQFVPEMDQFKPLDPPSEGSPLSTECIDTNAIKKIRKDQKCKEVCIPIQFSSLFDLSEIKICSDYEDHFCALDEIQYQYIWKISLKKQILCSKEHVKNSYKAEVLYSDGLPYWITKMVSKERINHILFYLQLNFFSDHVTVQEEELMYGPENLLSWIGGALGIFVGYSIFDLTSLLLDLVFQFVCWVI